MLTHRNIVWTVPGLPRPASASTPPGFRAVSYLPMAHIAERMTGHYLAGVGRVRGHHLPRAVTDRQLRPRGPPADDVRGAAGVGEDPRRRAGRPVGRPRGEGALRRGGRRGRADRRAAHGRHGHRRGRRGLGVPRRGGVQERAGADRPRRRAVRGDRRRTDPARAHPLVPVDRRPDVRGLRSVRDDRPDDVGSRTPCGSAPSAGRSPGSRSSSATTARCCAGAATCSPATSTTPTRPPTPSSPTAPSTPATSG